ncbi:MAG: nucleotidyltransferase domain-containing protein [Candidatus Woesearchaeota archaeon]
MHSKKDAILDLFFNSSKQWRFQEIKKAANISKPQLSNWLKILEKQNIVKRVKNKGEMPYYVQDFTSNSYETQKRLFALNMLSGLITHLAALPKSKVIILFGSLARSDWHGKSDIDIFIYPSDTGFKKTTYEAKLHREIQVHLAKNPAELQHFEKILPYILEGYFIKGSLQELGVEVNAKTKYSTRDTQYLSQRWIHQPS